MKGLFDNFDPSNDKDFKKIWSEALFVFDTNVLLNLYRYRKSTREALLSVLQNLSNRVWIPHHVALEFQRNRLKVIADQLNRFSEVHEAVLSTTKKLRNELDKLQLTQRHSIIDPEPLLKGIDEVASKFLTDLNTTREKQPRINATDPLKAQIEKIFDKRVGEEPENQEVLNAIYKEADKRFASLIPPGYMDQGKDKEGPDEHVHNNIIYKRKYGDYLVWHQLLQHTNKNKVGSVIFVTDDGKEDWWWTVKIGGAQTLGARPELINEAEKVGKLSNFLMYNSKSFLEFANEFLSTKVSQDAIDEVRDVSSIPSFIERLSRNATVKFHTIERAVYRWLIKKFPTVVWNERSHPDFVAKYENDRFGFEVKYFGTADFSRREIKNYIASANLEMRLNNFSIITIICILPNRSTAEEFERRIQLEFSDQIPEHLRILSGFVEREGDRSIFTPIQDISYYGNGYDPA